MKRFTGLLIALLISFSACSQQEDSAVAAQSPSAINYTTKVVVDNLNIPWGFTFLPDNSMLITEQTGELIHVKNGKKTIIEDSPKVYVRGQGGLLDIELHPNFKENRWVYISYASAEGEGNGGNTTIMRAKLVDNKFTENKVLYKAGPNTKRGQHFGSRIEFDNKGYLYFSIGDRGNRDENPQDITRDCGKIYRINDDGSIPKDNPFVNEPNAKTAIYSYGHRNPQGMIKHPETGEIWIHEHGPRGGDEINIVKAGKNYGWPVISYGINYSGTTFTDITAKEGMEQPLFYWVPSIAPCGMTIVTSDKYPDWKGNVLAGSLKFQYLERLELKNDKVVKREKLLEGIGRVRSIKQAPDGFIYVGVESVGIVKIIPNK